MRNVILLVSFIITIISCTTETVVEYKNNEFITLASEISRYYDIHLDTSGIAESGWIRKYMDGSLEFKYSYDLLDSDQFTPLFYSIKIEKETSIKEAIVSFNLAKTTLLTTNKVIGQGIIEIDSLMLPGDQNYYAIRTKDNSPNGLFLIIRDQTCLYTLVMAGLYSSDHSLVLDLVIPKIDDLGSFSLKGK